MSHRANSFACRDYQRTGVSRRHALRIGGAGLFGLTMPRWLRSQTLEGPRPRAKSVVFLFQFGGPSQLDTFDMKPHAPEGIRGPLRARSTSVPGLAVCEHLPETAKIMDKVCLVRSMHHEMKNHNSAAYYALTGHAPPLDDIRLRDTLDLFPAYGSVVDAVAPNEGASPTFVAYPHVIRDGAVTPGQHASFLGKARDPLLVTEDPNQDDFELPELSLPNNLSLDRLGDRRMLQSLVDKQTGMLEYAAEARGLDQYYDKALTMLSSDRVREAFNLSAESTQTRERYGRHTYGQSLLLARRLVESGVKFINVYFSSNIGGQRVDSGGWDTHGFNNTRMYPIIKQYHLPMTDATLPVFLNDLDDRGLLDETLVVWVGEFGRTPKINDNSSRDHWPQCYTALLAGGGVNRGYVHGASDKNGAYPARDPVRPDDLAATMYHLLGINPETEVHDAADRPLPITRGEPIHEIMA